MNLIKKQLSEVLSDIVSAIVKPDDFVLPPKNIDADLALPCFELAKELKKNPIEIAKDIARHGADMIEKSEANGPYVNFWFKDAFLVEAAFNEIIRTNKLGKTMVEFAHPNTHKAFHIGHLRNIITGESISRILEFIGHQVTRANYQGDVGLHIGKAMWGIEQLKDEYEEVKKKSLDEKVKFLGKAYALGGQTYETSENAKKEINELNVKIYEKDGSIQEVYETTRAWSLEHFDRIYGRLNTKFVRLYFESEVFKRGKELTLEYLKKKVFKKSQGAIIFEGEKYGLHSRVFVNSAGFPTYEAKDLALAETQFNEFNPEKIIHVVGKEQSDYFKVLFKALEFVLPESMEKEKHLAYGWVSLKSGKMSSRTGQVVLGEWLLDEIEQKISEVMIKSELENKDDVVKKVSLAAVKYAMLKIGVDHDMVFDIDESISVDGDSGPYLLYIVARVRSVMEKNEANIGLDSSTPQLTGRARLRMTEQKQFVLVSTEKKLLLELAGFEEIVQKAGQELDPSLIAKFLFDLAQSFNSFYHDCPILKADNEVKVFRLSLIKKVGETMEQGLALLGIETVDKM
jgi:arginyl-tRNA synthetase